MFEAAELGRRITKDDYQHLERELHMGLLEAQRKLEDAGFPVIVLLSGVEGAGKGGVDDCLHKWLDARGLVTAAFWAESEEERERPRYWRFWRQLPAKGQIGILFGSWYTGPIVGRAIDGDDEADFDRELHRIADFERLLTDDGALIVKLWLHLPEDEYRQRVAKDRKQKRYRTSPLTEQYEKHYDAFRKASEHALRVTDTGHAPWHVIEATDKRYRNITAGQILLEAMRYRLAAGVEAAPAPRTPLVSDSPITVLDTVDLSQTIDPDRYHEELDALQHQLHGLAWEAWRHGHNTVAVFEGWDAAGKGGAIRRVTHAIDARLYRTISIAAPTDEEKAHHYLWRFWRHIPRSGLMTIYDRSWYGRVLVERVEGFARHDEWARAYQEINDFEQQLREHGTTVLKFWIHIDKDEQLLRFEERQRVPWKHHKITDEDWRNRERWDDYALAVNDMVARTSTEHAPWTLVPGNDKRVARLAVLRAFVGALSGVMEKTEG